MIPRITHMYHFQVLRLDGSTYVTLCWLILASDAPEESTCYWESEFMLRSWKKVCARAERECIDRYQLDATGIDRFGSYVSKSAASGRRLLLTFTLPISTHCFAALLGDQGDFSGIKSSSE